MYLYVGVVEKKGVLPLGRKTHVIPDRLGKQPSFLKQRYLKQAFQ
jgi:hypothetical protein